MLSCKSFMAPEGLRAVVGGRAVLLLFSRCAISSGQLITVSLRRTSTVYGICMILKQMVGGVSGSYRANEQKREHRCTAIIMPLSSCCRCYAVVVTPLRFCCCHVILVMLLFSCCHHLHRHHFIVVTKSSLSCHHHTVVLCTKTSQ